jgi:hypothetical protein
VYAVIQLFRRRAIPHAQPRDAADSR